MTAVRATLAAVLFAVGLVLVAPAPPASACSCTGNGIDHFADIGDMIFRGTVVETDRAQGGSVLHTIDVAEVYRGTATATMDVRSASSEAACGLHGVDVGDDLLDFADPGRDPGDGLSTGLCFGTQPVTPGAIRQVEAITGAGSAPAPDDVRVDDDPPAGRWIPYWAVVTIAGGIVAALGVVLVATRRIRE